MPSEKFCGTWPLTTIVKKCSHREIPKKATVQLLSLRNYKLTEETKHNMHEKNRLDPENNISI